MDIRQQIGARIQKIRKEAGLSQEGLALAADLDRTYISHVERGTRNPTVIVIFKIAKALDTTPSKIFENMNL